MRTVPHTLLPLFSHRRRTVKGAPTFSCQMVKTKISLASAPMKMMMRKRMRRAKMQSFYWSAKRAFGSCCRSAKNLDVQSIARYPHTTKVRLFNLIWNDLGIFHNWQLDSFSLGIVTCTGAQVVAKMTCTQGHQSNWSSCTNVGEKKTSAASINVDLTASIFLSGLRFERVKVSFWIYLLNLSLLPQGVLRLDEHPFHFPLRLLQCKIMFIVHVWVMKRSYDFKTDQIMEIHKTTFSF